MASVEQNTFNNSGFKEKKKTANESCFILAEHTLDDQIYVIINSSERGQNLWHNAMQIQCRQHVCICVEVKLPTTITCVAFGGICTQNDHDNKFLPNSFGVEDLFLLDFYYFMKLYSEKQTHTCRISFLEFGFVIRNSFIELHKVDYIVCELSICHCLYSIHISHIHIHIHKHNNFNVIHANCNVCLFLSLSLFSLALYVCIY